MTVKEALTKVLEDGKAFPKGWNTDLAEICGAQGNNNGNVVWAFKSEDLTEWESAETLYRDKAKAKAAMEEEIRHDVSFYKDEGGKLVRYDEDHVQLEGRTEWSIYKLEVKD